MQQVIAVVVRMKDLSRKFSNLNGCLDEAAVFDRALTETEARTLYQAAGVKANVIRNFPESRDHMKCRCFGAYP